MKICMVGEGAFAHKHLQALQNIEDIQVEVITGGVEQATKDTAKQFNINKWTLDLAEALSIPEIEAAIITSPTPIHAAQALQVMGAGKHVMIEIPMSDSLKDAEAVCRLQKETGKIAMVGHTRRFNPSHQYVNQKIKNGELLIQQMNVQTYFFRRSNLNALGQPRSWTDHLLWHHAAHSVDLFMYQTGEKIKQVQIIQGPINPELKIAMDMSIGLKTYTDKICTISLSFNNNGPLGTFFRYICDNGTYIARYDELVDGYDKTIDVSNVDVSINGIELQDREFIAAIREGREPNASVHQILPCMQVLDQLEKMLEN